MTFSLAENVTEIDFVLVKKEHWRFLRNVKVVPSESQDAPVVADIDKRKKIRNVVRKRFSERRKMNFL